MLKHLQSKIDIDTRKQKTRDNRYYHKNFEEGYWLNAKLKFTKARLSQRILGKAVYYFL